MRVLKYDAGRDILQGEGEGGHTRLETIPANSQGRGKVAFRISDGSVLVLALQSWGEGRRHYYEWYARGEIG
jgi:hypothetical protein